MLSRVKGTHDFLDLRLFNFLVHSVQKHCALYNFTEIATPIIENTDLFKRSLGLETDVVSKEMFIVQGHKSEEEASLCLRPEATASTMRAFLQDGTFSTPWKVYMYGPMFRYERPQKGRFRQFHQVSIENIGCTSIDQDVQFITMLDRLFQERLLLDAYALQINFLGCPDDRARFKEVLHSFLNDHEKQLCSNCLVRKEHNILRIFDCKVETCKEIYKKAPHITDYLCASCKDEWQRLQINLQLLSISYTINPNLVRGLDYYDKTVFEFMSTDLGSQNAFCGGGRYSRLATALGAKHDVPSIGAAIGIERVLLLLEPIKDRLALPQPPPLQVIVPFSPEQHGLALLLADTLHAQNFCVDTLLEQESIKSMMRKAHKMGAQHCLLIGPDEQQTREVTVKNMITGHEERMKQVDVAAYLGASAKNNTK